MPVGFIDYAASRATEKILKFFKKMVLLGDIQAAFF